VKIRVIRGKNKKYRRIAARLNSYNRNSIPEDSFAIGASSYKYNRIRLLLTKIIAAG